MRDKGIVPVEGHTFQFTKQWFQNRNLPTFREYILPEWAGKPITYLELGVWEGMSMVWMLQYVLTHEQARGVGVDPWLMMVKHTNQDMVRVMNRAHANVKPWEDKCTLLRGNSSDVLRIMGKGRGLAGVTKGSVDICMVDGNHTDFAVLDDAKLCLQLLKPGGWMLFDDVENDHDKGRGHVKDGIDLFMKESDHLVDYGWKHRYMMCLKKI